MNNFTIQLVIKLLSLPSILIALTIHECAHGYAAYKLGDPTAKITGRLSINPLRHLDPIDFCASLIFARWAKPVADKTRATSRIEARYGAVVARRTDQTAARLAGTLSTESFTPY